ncbi:MAG: hypothetical protein E7458_04580 [Ruminococcaceae bacterium]|nr:hypothetical protein [Oscillospiraceae bacterium]
MSKKSQFAVIAVFLTFLVVFFAASLILPDRDFSERENRFLEGRPKFSFEALFSGKYIAEYETYSTDQFPFRDGWITLKARVERILGKQENNGVYLGEGDTLIEPFHAPETDVIQNNMTAVNKLAEGTEVPVYFALIPGKAEVWADRMSALTPNDSQKDLIDAAYALSQAETIDIHAALSAHRDEALYYRTDHHWTTLGAYYGAAAILDAMDRGSTPLADYSPRIVSDSFYGTTYSSSGFSWIAPDEMRVYVEPSEALTITNYYSGAPEAGLLYDESYLGKKDKYAMFFGGNTPLLTVDTGMEGERLLILRDSYTDCMAPFLFDAFSEIHLIDLRYYRASILQYIEENAIDRVLVLYNVDNFSTDTNFFLMGR